MSDEEHKDDKTNIVTGDTFKIRISEAENIPPSFVLIMGPANQVGRQWPIEREKILMGRAGECHVFIEDRSVSKKHVEVSYDGKEVYLKDLKSTNGTEISGRPMEPNVKHKLQNNDQIKVGNVVFKYLAKGNIESQSHQETFDRALLDSLTGIFNKGAFEAKGQEMFQKAKLLEMPLGVIVFDLDNFKSVNDTHGHQAGDYVLKELSEVIQRKLIRQGDVFGRWGGEEFSLILMGSPLKKSVEVAERIRKTIEDNQFIHKTLRLPITISVGVANLNSAINTWEELFEKADQASYMSKRNGKNRVSTI